MLVRLWLWPIRDGGVVRKEGGRRWGRLQVGARIHRDVVGSGRGWVVVRLRWVIPSGVTRGRVDAARR